MSISKECRSCHRFMVPVHEFVCEKCMEEKKREIYEEETREGYLWN